MTNPFRCFNSSPEVIRLVVRMYVKYPLSLRNVEDLLTAQFTTTSTGSATSCVRRRCAIGWSLLKPPPKQEPSTMKIITIGLDLAKGN
ncbi:MAG: family transposase [Caulobacteraceae bacterium]|nr:family transposase [Caulobacteraceae bacterium]